MGENYKLKLRSYSNQRHTKRGGADGERGVSTFLSRGHLLFHGSSDRIYSLWANDYELYTLKAIHSYLPSFHNIDVSKASYTFHQSLFFN